MIDARERIADAITRAGADAAPSLRMLDAHSECVCVGLGPSPPPTVYIDGTRDQPLTVMVYVRREAELEAQRVGELVADTLRDLGATEVDGPHEIGWDDGIYTQLVQGSVTVRERNG